MADLGLWRALAASVMLAALGSCTRANPDFCKVGEVECAQGFTCVEEMNRCEKHICEPDDFRGCFVDGDQQFAEVCSADGLQIVETACEFGCNDEQAACNECEPDQNLCDDLGNGPELRICGADGRFIDQRDCFLGCRVGGEDPECVDVDPSNGLAADLDFIDGTEVEDLELGDEFRVNSSGVIEDADGNPIPAVDSRIQTQLGAPSIRVFRVRNLRITGVVTLVGSDLIAFVADRDIDIDGSLIVASGRTTSGNCVGDGIEEDNGNKSGGGGGGFARNGASGGDAGGASGGSGGGQQGNSSLEPLFGGCNGGQVGNIETRGGVGAGGVQLVARQTIRIGPMGSIAANGGAGGYEFVNVGVASGASGGGSGGGILLEAPRLELDADALVAANGGGGGCAGTTGTGGQLGDLEAMGAACSSPAGSGGAGASANNQNADQGEDGGNTLGSGGGGGGSFGYIRVNVAIGQSPPAPQFSPRPDVAIIGQR